MRQLRIAILAFAALFATLAYGAGIAPQGKQGGTGVNVGTNTAGGVPLLSGAFTVGDCLSWASGGIVDAGAACAAAGIQPLNLGGTGAALTANNGGIVYSGASNLAILAGTATAGQCLLSGSSSAPSWGSCSGAAAVSSVANSDSTLTVSPTTGAVIASLNLAHANTWSATQTFSAISVTSTVSGTAFATYLASPPAIGGTTANAGSFTTLQAATSITDLGLSTAGLVTNTSGGVLGTVAYASASDVQTGTNATKPVTSSVLSAAQAYQTLTYGTTVNWNMQSGWNVSLTLTASTATIAAPTNIVAGQTYSLLLVQDGTGSRTLAGWNSAFDWGAAGAPTLTTTASKSDLISCLALSSLATATANTLYCVANKGF